MIAIMCGPHIHETYVVSDDMLDPWVDGGLVGCLLVRSPSLTCRRAPEKFAFEKEGIIMVFQPTFSSGELLNFRGVYFLYMFIYCVFMCFLSIYTVYTELGRNFL